MNQLKLILALAVPSVFFLQSCKPAATTDHVAVVNMDSVKAQITLLENNFAKASNAKDVDGVLVYYSDDAQSMAPNEPTWVGKDAIKAGIQREMASDTTEKTVAFETTGLWADGKYATETGKITVRNKEGNVIYNGKYMTLFELRNGKYVAIRDIWNDDAPKATPATPAAE
jgi:ketosteroid isomerase-like protein